MGEFCCLGSVPRSAAQWLATSYAPRDSSLTEHHISYSPLVSFGKDFLRAFAVNVLLVPFIEEHFGASALCWL